jgi:hypothetical protein
MNERIKELAFEANKDLDGNVPIGFAEKFAELIVGECMEVASPNYMNTPEDSAYYVELAIDRIADHFGVQV